MMEARNFPGIDPDGTALTEAYPFGNCPVCGADLDMRDLAKYWRINPQDIRWRSFHLRFVG